MNAPADQLAFHVRSYLPDAEGKSLEYRVKLIEYRDRAAIIRGQTTSRLAIELAAEAHERAGAVVYAADEPEQRLEMTVILCRRLIGAAMAAEQLDEGGGA